MRLMLFLQDIDLFEIKASNSNLLEDSIHSIYHSMNIAECQYVSNTFIGI